MRSLRPLIMSMTAAVAAAGCATTSGLSAPLRLTPASEPIHYLLVDAVEDFALAGSHRYTLVYTEPDPVAHLVADGKRFARTIRREQLGALLRELDESGAMVVPIRVGGLCNDCPEWRVLTRINSAQNSFVLEGSGVERPPFVARLAAWAGR